jgi:hypothetical protein
VHQRRAVVAALSWTFIGALSACNPLQKCLSDSECPPFQWCDSTVRLCVTYDRHDGGGTADSGSVLVDGGAPSDGGGLGDGGIAGDGGTLRDGGPAPETPFLDPDRTRLAFGGEFGHGVWVGTKTTETLQLRNLGKQPLSISAVSVEGADQGLFAARLSPASDGGAVVISATQRAFVQVAYAPSDAGSHEAALKVLSNAANQPTFTVPLAGKAVSP